MIKIIALLDSSLAKFSLSLAQLNPSLPSLYKNLNYKSSLFNIYFSSLHALAWSSWAVEMEHPLANVFSLHSYPQNSES